MFENLSPSETINQSLQAVNASGFWSYVNPAEYCPQWVADMQLSSAFGTTWAMPELGYDDLSNVASAAISMSPDLSTVVLAALSVTAVTGGLYGYKEYKKHKAHDAQANSKDTTISPEGVTKVLNALDLDKAANTSFRGDKIAKDRWANPETFKKDKAQFAKFLADGSEEATKALTRMNSSKEIQKTLLQEMNNYQVRCENPRPTRTRKYTP